MAIILRTAAVILASSFLMGRAGAEVSTQALLNLISTGPSSAAAEQQLEIRGAEDPVTRRLLSDRLPSLLVPGKNLNTTLLLAQLAGALKLVSTIPALCELLKQENRLPSDLYMAAHLLDDPVGAALAHIGKPSVPQVSALLQSQNSRTRTRAVRVLGVIGTPDARSAIQTASKSERDPRIRSFMLRLAQEKPSPP